MQRTFILPTSGYSTGGGVHNTWRWDLLVDVPNLRTCLFSCCRTPSVIPFLTADEYMTQHNLSCIPVNQTAVLSFDRRLRTVPTSPNYQSQFSICSMPNSTVSLTSETTFSGISIEQLADVALSDLPVLAVFPTGFESLQNRSIAYEFNPFSDSVECQDLLGTSGLVKGLVDDILSRFAWNGTAFAAVHIRR